LARRTVGAWRMRSAIAEPRSGSSPASAAVIVRITARSKIRATSGASTKRRPSGVSITIPSKMCSRALSCTRRTVPTWTPSELRTGVPRLSTL
jgi:hypothetical protein